jgi:hypothetical protein
MKYGLAQAKQTAAGLLSPAWVFIKVLIKVKAGNILVCPKVIILVK